MTQVVKSARPCKDCGRHPEADVQRDDTFIHCQNEKCPRSGFRAPSLQDAKMLWDEFHVTELTC